MAGRASAFADPEIIELAKTTFVPACADDWYQRRRQDAEGEFWKKVYMQGPRATGSGTRQGIYTLTADGELLAYKNAGQSAKSTRDQLALALRKWNALPEARRKPGGVKVEARGKLDPNFSRTPPAGGLIVRVHARILDKKDDGYFTGLPLINSDPDTGVGFGARVLWFDNGSRDDVIFEATPYRHRLYAQALSAGDELS